MNIDQDLAKKFLDMAGKQLRGDWILMGGALLIALGEKFRITLDIDLVGKTEGQSEQNLKLMEIAEGLGLPVEAVNQAGAFFLQRIKKFESRLILMHKGENATIYRPNLALFMELKVGRLSESDLSDCFRYLKYCRKVDESIDWPAILKHLDLRLGKESNPEKRNRIVIIQNKLKGFQT